MKAATLFTGIGAPECAARDLPIEFLWGAEIDPFANAVMRHHFPDHINLGDITARGFLEKSEAAGLA